MIGGRADVMALFHASEPARRVLIAGTYNAHPLACAAAIATIEKLQADDGAVYRDLEQKGAGMQAGLESLFRERGMSAVVSRLGSAFCVYFMDHVPAEWHDLASHHDFDLDRRYRRALIERGIYHFPAACKQGSISAAHTMQDVETTLERTRDALRGL